MTSVVRPLRPARWVDDPGTRAPVQHRAGAVRDRTSGRHHHLWGRVAPIRNGVRAAEQWRRRRPRTVLTAAVTAVAMLTTLGWGTAEAAFYKITSTGTNSWTTGTVTFSANSPASALFTAASIQPGSTDTQCIKLTYSGNVTAQVRLYVSSLTGTGLGTLLTLQVNEGTGNNQSCSDFAQTANDYNATGMTDTTKTLATFASAKTNYSTGVSAWNTGVTTTKTYQFIWRMQADNAGTSDTANVTFTWEADSL